MVHVFHRHREGNRRDLSGLGLGLWVFHNERGRGLQSLCFGHVGRLLHLLHLLSRQCLVQQHFGARLWDLRRPELEGLHLVLEGGQLEVIDKCLDLLLDLLRLLVLVGRDRLPALFLPFLLLFIFLGLLVLLLALRFLLLRLPALQCQPGLGDQLGLPLPVLRQGAPEHFPGFLVDGWVLNELPELDVARRRHRQRCLVRGRRHGVNAPCQIEALWQCDGSLRRRHRSVRELFPEDRVARAAHEACFAIGLRLERLLHD
mmetsp:Transcript_83315/g.232335  ORF Transcript_83315/g.232335 Transcript_83315/m.232335 type:complete len:259 (+) Transcript_83315:1791-2567(+)